MRIHITVLDNKGNNYEGTVDLVKVKSKRKMKNPQTKSQIIKAPRQAIYKIYLKNFFKTEKGFDAIIARLKSDGFNFKKDSVLKALKRTKYLITSGKKGNPKFVQKYPPR